MAVLTWEYPPRVIGETAVYAQVLCKELAGQGVEVHVVTYHESLRGMERDSSGVYVHRVSNPVPTHINILTWDLAMSPEFERICADVHYDIGPLDLIDCHEWLSVIAATSASRALEVPFIMTLDSLEEYRSNFSIEPLNLAIRSIERIGTCESSLIVVKSDAMRNAVMRLHGVVEGKIQVVHKDVGLGGRALSIYADVATKCMDR